MVSQLYYCHQNCPTWVADYKGLFTEKLEAYAALRTAQLEGDKAALCQVVKDYERMTTTLREERDRQYEETVNRINRVGIAETRAETAESALRQIVEVYVKFSTEHYPWKDPLLEKPICNCGFRFADKEEFVTHIRALLTVAAQTPQQVKNPGAGEKEER